MNEDGRMARLVDLIKFSKKHNIKIASIADIIAYRLKNEKLVYKTQAKAINSNYLNKSILTIYKNKLNNLESFVFSRGKFKKKISVPIRVLSKKINKKKIFTNSEIKKNLKLLSKFKNFLLIIINNEKSKSQINETNLTLRYYGIGAQIIKDLNLRNIILLSRTKKKIIGLEGFGLKIKKQIIIK